MNETQPEKKNLTEEKAKAVATYCLGDVFECSTSHLAARMIVRQVVGRISIWGGWWFDVV